VRTIREANRLIIEFDVATDQPVADQMWVFARALNIYADRHRKYGLQWKDQGWRGQLFHLRACAGRALRTLWNGGKDVDDLLDAINYGAMAVRLLEVEHAGDWEWPDGNV